MLGPPYATPPDEEKAEVTTPDSRPLTHAIPPQDAVAQERSRDDEHLRLLSIFHFVLGGLVVLMLPLLSLHLMFAYSMFTVFPFLAGPDQNAPPQEAFQIIFWVYPIVGLLFLTAAAINLLSGWFLLRKRHRVYSLVVAGLDCLNVPYGTALGVFTILVLTRSSVEKMYEAGPHG